MTTMPTPDSQFTAEDGSTIYVYGPSFDTTPLTEQGIPCWGQMDETWACQVQTEQQLPDTLAVTGADDVSPALVFFGLATLVLGIMLKTKALKI